MSISTVLTWLAKAIAAFVVAILAGRLLVTTVVRAARRWPAFDRALGRLTAPITRAMVRRMRAVAARRRSK
ncbi:MAG: hypothetical protein HOP28_15935 [Gemmatimonadales bacterium]|nr:hypothetical protein [Gemmatimonadales bacterium]